MRILLFTGKGGVGKTTAAVATALRLADRGNKTLLLSTDAAHSVGDAVGLALDGEPREIEPALWAMQLDSQLKLEDAWRSVRHYLLSMMEGAGVDPITAEELAILPGIEEVLALLTVRDLARSGDWDTLVVDCAPTAETLRLLALPEALSWYLTKIFPAHRKLARGMRPFASLLGRGELIPPDGLFAALLQLCDELASVRALLADPLITSVRLVLTPEAVVAAEARRTFTALSLYGYQVDMVVANRVFPSAAGSRNSWLQGWVRAQREQLAGLQESFAGVAIREVPYGGSEPVGVAALREVATHLYALPLVEVGDVDAARVEDDLVVTVGAYRRVLSLPSVLRRCTIVSGRMADGHLRLRFRPDPDLWPAGAVEQPEPAANV
jgi:arsenite-transporting ATPase